MAQSYKQQLAAAQAKLTALTAKIAELTPLADAEVDVTVDLSTFIGRSVFARVGRCTADGKIPRIVQAVVLAAKAGEGKSPAQLKITFGDGFDAEVVAVTLPAVSETREAAEAALAVVVADYNKAKAAAEAAAAAAEAAATGAATDTDTESGAASDIDAE